MCICQGLIISTHIRPSAGPMSICTLVSGELIDQDSGVVVVVNWAFASTDSAAGSRDWAVGLCGVLQGTCLHVQSEISQCSDKTTARTDLVVPCACAARISTLVTGVDVDQYTTTISGQICWTLAIPAPTVACKGNVLSGTMAWWRWEGPPPWHAGEADGGHSRSRECCEGHLEQRHLLWYGCGAQHWIPFPYFVRLPLYTACPPKSCAWLVRARHCPRTDCQTPGTDRHDAPAGRQDHELNTTAMSILCWAKGKTDVRQRSMYDRSPAPARRLS